MVKIFGKWCLLYVQIFLQAMRCHSKWNPRFVVEDALGYLAVARGESQSKASVHGCIHIEADTDWQFWISRSHVNKSRELVVI
jgi:hypothetical protein